MGLEASIVVIGDEILGGFVQDTNSGWLAGRLREHGVPLSRIVTVPDDPAAIDDALQRELARSRPRLILTCGGIGSTPDDVTYEAIAASLERPLMVAPELAQRIDASVAWTVRQGVAVGDGFVDHLMRMAMVPEGATLLRRTRGWVPGIRVDVGGGIDDDDGATIVILPGVPSELRGIVDEAVEPDLLAGRGVPDAVEELTHGFPESVLNEAFARLIERYPDVKLGSYPGDPMLVRLRGPAGRVASAMAELRAEVEALASDDAGGRLLRAWEERTTPLARIEQSPP